MIKEELKGKTIIVKGMRIVITEVISARNYGKYDYENDVQLTDNWYIEFRNQNGRYCYWKQECDGGILID